MKFKSIDDLAVDPIGFCKNPQGKPVQVFSARLAKPVDGLPIGTEVYVARFFDNGVELLGLINDCPARVIPISWKDLEANIYVPLMPC